MEIEGNLIIRWHERGAFDVSLVPTGPVAGAPGPTRRLADAAALQRLLGDLGLEPRRVARVVASPYVLQSLRVRVDRRRAARARLVPTTRLWRALDRTAQAVTAPVRAARRAATRRRLRA